jgi:2-amino-1-hydroxyethylphosphonate dioxygenase (glycine-forming)
MEALNLLKKYGDNGYIGEDVTQLQHAFQCAMFAEDDSDVDNKNDFILGCLFHDIGHLLCYDNPEMEKMSDLGVMNHEKVGADYLRSLGYNENVCELVENHINTKRYLISTDPNYYNNLSEASKQTFEYQGGKLSYEEINSFKQNKLFKYHLKLRTYDDQAKSTEYDLIKKIDKMNNKDYYSSIILSM